MVKKVHLLDTQVKKTFTVRLCIKRPQMIRCVKYFKNNKYINLLVYDRELLKKYNAIWDKIRSLLKNNLIVYHCIILNSLELR